MDSNRRASSALVSLAAAVIVIAGLKLAQPLLAPLLLAVLLTATFAPIAAWLSSRGLPAAAAAGVAMLVGLAGVGALGALIGYSLDDARIQLPAYWSRTQSLATSVTQDLTRVGIRVSGDTMASLFDANRLMNFASSTLSTAADVLAHVVVMPLLVFFAIAEIAGFGNKVRFILPTHYAKVERMELAVREVQKYLLVKTATSLVAAAAVGLLLVVFKVDFAVLLAVLVFVLHFIPNIGMAVATAPGVLVALLQHGPGAALVVGAGYLIISTVVGSVLEPKVMGRTLGLSPLVVLLAMVLWGWLWGPVGALVSVPLTMIAKISFENSKHLRWVAALLGPTDAYPAIDRRQSLMPLAPGSPVGLGSGPISLKLELTRERRKASQVPLGTVVEPPT